MNWNKERILNRIKECEMGVKMSEDVLRVVAECKHWARIDKRFIDKIKDIGYHAYIVKDKWSQALSISSSSGFAGIRAEIRYYVSACISKKELSWSELKEKIAQNDYAGELEKAKDRLGNIDAEVIRVEKLLAHIKAQKFTCFDFYKSVYEIEDALRECRNKLTGEKS